MLLTTVMYLSFSCLAIVSTEGLWSSKISSTNQWAEAVSIDSNGCVAVTGVYQNYLTVYDFNNITTRNGVGRGVFAVKYDATGKLLWTALIKLTTSLYTSYTSRMAAFDSNNNLIITGTSDEKQVEIVSSSGYSNKTAFAKDYNFFVIKFDQNGEFKWISSIVTDGYDDYNKIVIDKSSDNVIIEGGQYVSTGYIYDSKGMEKIYSAGPSTQNGFIICFSASGEYSWHTTISNVQIWSSSIDDDGNYAVIGPILSFPVQFISFNNNTSRISRTVSSTAINFNNPSFVAKYKVIDGGIDFDWAVFTQDYSNSRRISMGRNGDLYALLATGAIKVYDSNVNLRYTGGCTYCANIVKFNTTGFLMWATSIRGVDSSWMNSWQITFQTNTVIVYGPLYSVGPWRITNAINFIPLSTDGTIMAGISENGNYMFHYQIAGGDHKTYYLSSQEQIFAILGNYNGIGVSLHNSSNHPILSFNRNPISESSSFVMVFSESRLRSETLPYSVGHGSFSSLIMTKSIISSNVLPNATSEKFEIITVLSTPKLSNSPIFTETLETRSESPDGGLATSSKSTFNRNTKEKISASSNYQSDIPGIRRADGAFIANNSVSFLLIGGIAFLFCILLSIGIWIIRNRQAKENDYTISTSKSQTSMSVMSSRSFLTEKSTVIMKPRAGNSTAISVSSAKTLSVSSPLSIPVFTMYQYGIDFRPEKTLVKNRETSAHIGTVYHPNILENFVNPVFIKEYNSLRFNNASSGAFLQEVSFMYLLKDHKNIAKFIGFSQNPYCIVMKYYPMGSLRKYLFDKQKKKTKRIQIRIMLDISEGISFMASKGVAHCDLKPDNVLIELETSGRLTAVIADFEMTCLFNDESQKVAGLKLNNIRGFSLYYAAPESILKFKRYANAYYYHPLTSDIYSLGMIIFAILTRSVAWKN